jgi:hypothetical protein
MDQTKEPIVLTPKRVDEPKPTKGFFASLFGGSNSKKVEPKPRPKNSPDQVQEQKQVRPILSGTVEIEMEVKPDIELGNSNEDKNVPDFSN